MFTFQILKMHKNKSLGLALLLALDSFILINCGLSNIILSVGNLVQHKIFFISQNNFFGREIIVMSQKPLSSLQPPLLLLLGIKTVATVTTLVYKSFTLKIFSEYTKC